MSSINSQQRLAYISFVSRMHEVLGSMNVIKALAALSEEQWNRSFDTNTEEHLIRGVFSSPQKSDAVRIYIAKLMKVHLNSIGNRVCAWTKDTIAGENATNVAISNRIAATEFKSSYELFQLVATRLMGYDDMLIKLALAEDASTKTKLLMNYVSSLYDLSVPDKCATEIYIDQAVRIEGLLVTDALTTDYVLEHINQVGRFFKDLDEVVVNLWDLFETLSYEIEAEAVTGASGLDKYLDYAFAPVVGVLLDKNDPDPLGTIKAARKAFFEAHPKYLTAVSEPCLSMPELVDALRKAANEGTQVDAINLHKLLPQVATGTFGEHIEKEMMEAPYVPCTEGVKGEVGGRGDVPGLRVEEASAVYVDGSNAGTLSFPAKPNGPLN